MYEAWASFLVAGVVLLSGSVVIEVARLYVYRKEAWRERETSFPDVAGYLFLALAALMLLLEKGVQSYRYPLVLVAGVYSAVSAYIHIRDKPNTVQRALYGATALLLLAAAKANENGVWVSEMPYTLILASMLAAATLASVGLACSLREPGRNCRLPYSLLLVILASTSSYTILELAGSGLWRPGIKDPMISILVLELVVAAISLTPWMDATLAALALSMTGLTHIYAVAESGSPLIRWFTGSPALLYAALIPALLYLYALYRRGYLPGRSDADTVFSLASLLVFAASALGIASYEGWVLDKAMLAAAYLVLLRLAAERWSTERMAYIAVAPLLAGVSAALVIGGSPLLLSAAAAILASLTLALKARHMAALLILLLLAASYTVWCPSRTVTGVRAVVEDYYLNDTLTSYSPVPMVTHGFYIAYLSIRSDEYFKAVYSDLLNRSGGEEIYLKAYAAVRYLRDLLARRGIVDQTPLNETSQPQAVPTGLVVRLETDYGELDAVFRGDALASGRHVVTGHTSRLEGINLVILRARPGKNRGNISRLALAYLESIVRDERLAGDRLRLLVYLAEAASYTYQGALNETFPILVEALDNEAVQPQEFEGELEAEALVYPGFTVSVFLLTIISVAAAVLVAWKEFRG